jgi:hypothetical protein
LYEPNFTFAETWRSLCLGGYNAFTVKRLSFSKACWISIRLSNNNINALWELGVLCAFCGLEKFYRKDLLRFRKER